MQVLALTGGIGAGKSTVGAMFEARGAARIDSDQLSREAVAKGSDGLQAVVSAFGDAVVASDGSLNRAALGDIVFSSDEARTRLNAIVHPIVRGLLQARLDELQRDERTTLVVYEIPLLVETGATGPWSAVVTVEAPIETRVARLVASRNLSAEQARDRIAAQASETQRRAIADWVIESGGSLAETEAQVSRVWRLLERRASARER